MAHFTAMLCSEVAATSAVSTGAFRVRLINSPDVADTIPDSDRRNQNDHFPRVGGFCPHFRSCVLNDAGRLKTSISVRSY
jgi:hypothetical protein